MRIYMLISNIYFKQTYWKTSRKVSAILADIKANITISK